MGLRGIVEPSGAPGGRVMFEVAFGKLEGGMRHTHIATLEAETIFRLGMRAALLENPSTLCGLGREDLVARVSRVFVVAPHEETIFARPAPYLPCAVCCTRDEDGVTLWNCINRSINNR